MPELRSTPSDRSRGRQALEALIRGRAQRAIASRHVFGYLAGATALLGLGVGFVMTIIDHRDFPTFGDGIWWAVVTLGTVGYGDIVPHTGWGRVLGSVVIVAGVTFITFLTATVTSLFVSADQQELIGKTEDRYAASEEETRALLKHVLERLESIEDKLDQNRA